MTSYKKEYWRNNSRLSHVCVKPKIVNLKFLNSNDIIWLLGNLEFLVTFNNHLAFREAHFKCHDKIIYNSRNILQMVFSYESECPWVITLKIKCLVDLILELVSAERIISLFGNVSGIDKISFQQPTLLVLDLVQFSFFPFLLPVSRNLIFR